MKFNYAIFTICFAICMNAFAQNGTILDTQYGRSFNGLNGGRFGGGVGKSFNKVVIKINYSITDLSYNDTYYLKGNFLILDKDFTNFPLIDQKSYSDFILSGSKGYARLYPRVFTTQIKTIDISAGRNLIDKPKLIAGASIGLCHYLVDERVQALEWTSKITFANKEYDTNLLAPFYNKFYDIGYNITAYGGYKLKENLSTNLNLRFDRMAFSQFALGSVYLSLVGRL
jgi:hypothetical protein